MRKTHSTVGIIGGGLAGTYTAYLLAQHNITFEIIESKPVLGGRIYGENTDSSDYKVDLGPSWIFPHQQEIQKLVADLGLRLVDQFTSGDAVFQRNSHDQPQKLSGIAPPAMHRIFGGTTRLIDALADNIEKQDIRLSTTANLLRYNGECWQIKTNNQQPFTAAPILFDHLVIAAPPRVIAHKLSYKKAHVVEVINEAGQGKAADGINMFLQDLSNKFARTPTWMAAQAKFAITYSTPFWRKGGLSGQAFSHVGPMGEVHDASFEDADGNSVFALFGFIGVPFSHRQQISDEQMKDACVLQLRTLFGPQASEYQQTYYKDWANDVSISNALDHQQASAHPHIDLNSEHAQLKQIKLHLASSEFAHKEAGYMEGAVLAAQRAVKQILLTIDC